MTTNQTSMELQWEEHCKAAYELDPANYNTPWQVASEERKLIYRKMLEPILYSLRDKIEENAALRRCIDRRDADLVFWGERVGQFQAERNMAQAEITPLRKALERIAGTPGNRDHCEVARSVLPAYKVREIDEACLANPEAKETQRAFFVGDIAFAVSSGAIRNSSGLIGDDCE